MKASFKEYDEIIKEIEEKQKITKDFLRAIQPTDLRCMRCGNPIIGHEIGLYNGVCQDCYGQRGNVL